MSDHPADSQPARTASPSLGGFVALIAVYGVFGVAAWFLALLSGNPLQVAYVFIPVIGACLVISIALLARGRLAMGLVLGFLALPLAFGVAWSLSPTVDAIEAVTGWRPGNRDWREVVRTSDGTEFVVKRGEKKSRYSGIHDEIWIEGDLPGTGYFSWHSSLAPWLLDRTGDGTWYLVGRILSRKSEADYGIYNSRHGGVAFIPFRLVGGNWQRVTAAEVPADFKVPNLLLYGEFVFEPRGDEYSICEGGKRAGGLGVRALGNGDLVGLPLKSRFIPCGNERSRPEYELKRERFDDGLHNTRQCEPLKCGLLPVQQPAKR